MQAGVIHQLAASSMAHLLYPEGLCMVVSMALYSRHASAALVLTGGLAMSEPSTGLQDMHTNWLNQ